jgi:hypothetical protein
MKTDKFVKTMLIIIAVLLFVNIFKPQIQNILAPEALAQQPLNFAGTSISIICSDNGKYVYATDGGSIFRSDDYGEEGTWVEVVE